MALIFNTFCFLRVKSCNMMFLKDKQSSWVIMHAYCRSMHNCGSPSLIKSNFIYPQNRIFHFWSIYEIIYLTQMWGYSTVLWNAVVTSTRWGQVARHIYLPPQHLSFPSNEYLCFYQHILSLHAKNHSNSRFTGKISV